MAEITVTERTREQGRRLKKLRADRHISKPLLCSRLGFGSTQTYDLYERGVSIIRMDRVEVWAEAFNMTREDFIEAVLGDGDPAAGGWTFREALRGHIPEYLIERYAPDWEGRPLLNQMAAVEAMKQMAGEIRLENTGGAPKSNTA